MGTGPNGRAGLQDWINGGVRLDVCDAYGMREVNAVAQVDANREAPFGPAGFGHVRAQLHQEKRRGFGGWMSAAHLGETMHLLEKLH